MPQMRVAQIGKPGGEFEIVTREVPQPGPGQVRIKVEACGICHSDSMVKHGYWPGLVYPRVPGHEVAGTIDEVGPGVQNWQKGQRVGVGWHGGHCHVCDACRRGDFVSCERMQIPGFAHDGGYAEYMINPVEGLALIPDDMQAKEAAPLMCAGITTFNSLRHSGARAGDVVAIQGLGGLGHLGIQFARQMGFHTVAIGRGKEKEELARKLGAHEYLDDSLGNTATALGKMGGAKVVLATAPSSSAMAGLVDGLSVDGTLLIVGAAPEPMPVNVLSLLSRRRSIKGWPSGTSRDSEDTMRFSARTGVRPMIETFPLAEAAQAYERMISGKVRFRSVIIM